MFIHLPPAAIFACTSMKTLFTSAVTDNRLKSNPSQDYTVFLFLMLFLVFNIFTALNRESCILITLLKSLWKT